MTFNQIRPLHEVSDEKYCLRPVAFPLLCVTGFRSERGNIRADE
jgi:hypothetical protein